MIRQTIKYKDYNGNDVTEDLYFNLTKAEIIELEMASGGGLSESLKRIAETQDGRLLLKQFKNIIALSFGEKTEDGRRFIKDPATLKAFLSSEAYSQFFMDLMTIENAAANFIKGVLPADIINEVVKELEAADASAEAAQKIAEEKASEPEVITRTELNTMSANDKARVMVAVEKGEARIAEDLQ